MKNKVPFFIAIFIFITSFAIFGILLYSKPQVTNLVAEKSPEQASQEQPPQGKAKWLLFFLDPAGKPCQLQDSILQTHEADIKKNNTEIIRIPTNSESSYSLFAKYGVRSLPSLILIDEQEKEIHRWTPGIQDIEKILPLLQL